MKRLYWSKDSKIKTVKPVDAREAVAKWLQVYSMESVSHMAAPISYILDEHFYETTSFPVARILTFNAGGGCLLDLVYLKNGRVLGITDESVVLYASEKDFEEDRQELLYRPFNPVASIAYKTACDSYSIGQPAWIDSIGYYHGLVELNMCFKQSVILNQDKIAVSTNEVL